jgi:methyl-accepting chemotaxis protein
MMTVPVNLLLFPEGDLFEKYIRYCVIGAVCTGFACYLIYNLLIKKIQKSDKEIGKTLFTEMQNLSVAAKENAATSQDQSAAVKEIVATMQDTNELVSSIGDKIKHVTSLADSSRNAVLSGNEALQNSVQELLSIKNTNKLTIEGIKELNNRINGIWDIVSIINNVADQTKIIAFNAELEASSSGEAGKNFHIVATEIRRLSDNIIDSIKEIRERTNEIQQASDALILDSEKATRQIDSGYNSAKSLENQFESIMTSSNNTANSSREILDFVSQMASSSEQIFITLKQIAHGIENFAQSTENISASSENVKKIASKL